MGVGVLDDLYVRKTYNIKVDQPYMYFICSVSISKVSPNANVQIQTTNAKNVVSKAKKQKEKIGLCRSLESAKNTENLLYSCGLLMLRGRACCV